MSKNGDSPTFGYVFPAIRGIQANREYYVSMCPLRVIPKIFLFDEEELVPELRAQRTLNKARVPEMARYMTDNRDGYVFSAITASIDGDVHFEALGADPDRKRIGTLQVSMDSRFIINDGQHRRAAIEQAMREKPDLADESIAVVFFLDHGLDRCQQMFADLNRYAIRPSKSLGVLYDHRDAIAQVARLVVMRSELFRDTVEMERTTLSRGSRKLFTLSSIYGAIKAQLGRREFESVESATAHATEFWETVFRCIPEWNLVRQRKMTAGDVRRDFIHSHGIALHAIGQAGNVLVSDYPRAWKRRLQRLKKINWTRANAELWEGRALIGGRVSKAGQNVALTTNLVKSSLGLDLTPEELRTEQAFLRSRNGRKKQQEA